MDVRAVVASLLVVAGIVGGASYYALRPRAVNSVRSLTAAPPRPSTRETRTLHVDGCSKDFVVRVGELVEPRVTPGASLAQLESFYGDPVHERAHRLAPGTLRFMPAPFTFTVVQPTRESPGSVSLEMHPGHVVETIDDIELGIDSFATLRRKMRDLKLDIREEVTRHDNQWTLAVTIPSNCGRDWTSVYSRTLDDSPELEHQLFGALPADPTDPHSQPTPAQTTPRPDPFYNRIVESFTLQPPNHSQQEAKDAAKSTAAATGQPAR